MNPNFYKLQGILFVLSGELSGTWLRGCIEHRPLVPDPVNTGGGIAVKKHNLFSLIRQPKPHLSYINEVTT
jgi:hypothetical protein